jgi:ribosome-binding factor A
MLKEISEIVAGELRDTPPAMITFTRVEITRDLKLAKIFYSVLGFEKEIEKCTEYLRRHAGVIRHNIGRRMRIHALPELTFHYDASTDNVIRINEILEQLKKDEDKP